MTLVFAPVLIVVSVWLYTLVFAFSALWFAHYALAALAQMRAAADVQASLALRPLSPADVARRSGEVIELGAAAPLASSPSSPPALPPPSF